MLYIILTVSNDRIKTRQTDREEQLCGIGIYALLLLTAGIVHGRYEIRVLREVARQGQENRTKNITLRYIMILA